MFRKCPRCELNYIRDEEKYCKVCLREMKGEDKKDEIELCTICNENIAIPGKDVCLFCLKEMNRQQGNDKDDDDAPAPLDDPNVDIDPVSSMDEIIPDIQEDDIPEKEYGEIESDLSLDEMGEDEDREEDDSDNEEEA